MKILRQPLFVPIGKISDPLRKSDAEPQCQLFLSVRCVREQGAPD
jgi:hypothetical protein